MSIDYTPLESRLTRARSVIGQGIKYGLGQGGMNPDNPTPASPTWKCDCSGFVSWVLHMSRKPKVTRWWWIETTNVYKDATGRQKVFVKIDKPVPGCIVVYPDRSGHEGHIGIVSEIRKTGYDVIDCSGSKNGIYEHSGAAFMTKANTIFCLLKQDIAK